MRLVFWRSCSGGNVKSWPEFYIVCLRRTRVPSPRVTFVPRPWRKVHGSSAREDSPLDSKNPRYCFPRRERLIFVPDYYCNLTNTIMSTLITYAPIRLYVFLWSGCSFLACDDTFTTEMKYRETMTYYSISILPNRILIIRQKLIKRRCNLTQRCI